MCIQYSSTNTCNCTILLPYYSIRYFCHFVSKTEATLDLMYNTSVACPGETVLFTCFIPGGVALQWRVDPPAESMLMSKVQTNPFDIFSQVGRRDTFGSGVIMFEAVFVTNDDGNLTSTLIDLSEVSVLDGSNVTCTATINNGVVIESQQTVTVAGEFLNSPCS